MRFFGGYRDSAANGELMDMQDDKKIALIKGESWKTRYWIVVAVLTFACYEFDRVISACTSPAGCKEGITTQTLIEGIQQLILWSFIVVILGRAAQPLINRLAFFKFGGGASADADPKPTPPATPPSPQNPQ